MLWLIELNYISLWIMLKRQKNVLIKLKDLVISLWLIKTYHFSLLLLINIFISLIEANEGKNYFFAKDDIDGTIEVV